MQREHEAADDAELLKLHQNAAAGKLRGKRRDRGIGLGESDSEDEYRARPKIYAKKRKIDGDELEALGEPAAYFHQIYHTHAIH